MNGMHGLLEPITVRAEVLVHYRWGKCQMNTICFSAQRVWESVSAKEREEMIRARFESYVKEHPDDFIFPVDRVEVVSFRSGADIVTFEGIGPYSCLVVA